MDCRRALLQVERVAPVIQSCRSVGVYYYFQGCRLLETGVAWSGALGELRASLIVEREGSGFILAGPRTRPTESVTADRYLLSACSAERHVRTAVAHRLPAGWPHVGHRENRANLAGIRPGGKDRRLGRNASRLLAGPDRRQV